MALPLRKVSVTKHARDNVVGLPPPKGGAPRVRCFDELRAPKSSRTLAVILVLLLAVIVISLIYVPWQQSVTGLGQVFIFNPGDRPQNVEAQISGRLKRWNAAEGQTVKAGDVIAEIEEIDPKYLDPHQLERLRSQRAAQVASRAAAEARLAALEGQLNDLANSRVAQIPAADQRARMARDRLEVARQNVAQGKQSVTTAELNLKRLAELFDKGLRSKRDLELAELEIVTQRTRLEALEAQLALAEREVEAFGLDRERVVNDTSAQLNGVRVSIASVRETIAKIDGDLFKLDVDIQNLDQRVGQRAVRAPRDGRLVRVLKVGAGETVKAGTVLAQLAPTTEDQTAEIFLSDYDAPLVQVGDPVRVSFDGWPAIQFVGWPSVAVGTFAGRVKVIDAVGDEAGRVRIVVEPDREAVAKLQDEPWPPLEQLRPGTGARGWVMLRTVSLGFELWRQFNAFPASRDKPVVNKNKAANGGDSGDEGKEDAGDK
jgi:membrane fusion protein, adhesin transport system